MERNLPLKSETDTPTPPLIKRNTLLLASSQAFVGAGMQMTPTLGAIMVVRLLGSANLAGLGTAILGLGRLAIAYPVGKINDTYGRKVGLLLGLLLSLVGALLTGASMAWTSFPLFIVGMAFFGLGVGAGLQLRVAAADMYPPNRRAQGLGIVLMGSVAGALGGPALVSAAQASSHSLHIDPLALSWIFVPAVILPSIFLVLLVHPDPKDIARNLARYYPGYRPSEEELANNSGAGFTSFFRHYPKRVAFVSSFAVQGNMAMMMAMTSLVLAHHGHPLPAISLAVAIHVIGMFGFSLPLGRLADSLGRRPVLLAGIALAGAGSALVPITSQYWSITLGIFLVGVGWSCVNVAATALIADTTTPGERGRAIGANDTFSSASAVLLPLAAGPVAEANLFMLGIMGVGLMVIPFLLLMRLREPKPGRYEETALA